MNPTTPVSVVTPAPVALSAPPAPTPAPIKAAPAPVVVLDRTKYADFAPQYLAKIKDKLAASPRYLASMQVTYKGVLPPVSSTLDSPAPVAASVPDKPVVPEDELKKAYGAESAVKTGDYSYKITKAFNNAADVLAWFAAVPKDVIIDSTTAYVVFDTLRVMNPNLPNHLVEKTFDRAMLTAFMAEPTVDEAAYALFVSDARAQELATEPALAPAARFTAPPTATPVVK